MKARQTSKQTNIHANKHRTLKARCLQPQVKMERRVEWSNIICHEQTSNIFCNHFRVCATDIIHQVSSVTLNVSTRVTLQNNTLQSIKPFTILTMMARKATFGVTIRSEYKSQSYIAILDQSTRHSICAGGLEASLFLSTMFVCMYVGLFA